MECLLKFGFKFCFYPGFSLKNQKEKLIPFVLDFIVCSWLIYPSILEDARKFKEICNKIKI